LLKPKELDQWPDASLLLYARYLKARKEEVDDALRRRGFLPKW